MSRTKGSKNKQVPLSKESKKLVEKGIQEAKEGKLERVDVKTLEATPTKMNPKLKECVADLTKKFGHEIIHMAKDEKVRDKISFIIPEVNKMIGGGIRHGSFSIIWGNKSTAKTTAVYYLIAQAQKENKTCFYIDLEHSFDPEWAKKCGVNLDTLLIGHFENAEEAMDTLIKMSKEKAVDFIILDSVQSLSPKGEQETKKGVEKSTEDDTMALLARKLSQFFRMAGSAVYTGNVAVLLIGQARTDLGGFIKLDTLSGGHALNHWSVLTIKFHRGQKVDAPTYKFEILDKKDKKIKKEIIIGFSLVIRVEKTKVSGSAPENTELRIPFYFGFGFYRPTDEQIHDMYSDWISFEASIEEEK
jgi:RecA/RadA recombinase